MSNREDRNPDALSNIFFHTSRTAKGFGAIQEAIEAGWEMKYCKATRIFGPPGTGKTHTLTYFQQIVCAKKGWKILNVEVAPNSNPRKFGEQLLEGLGDPNPEHGSESQKLRRAKEAVEEQDYDCIAIEELHRLIDDKTDRVNPAVGHFITGFLNLRACPLILMGEPSAARVFAGNEMLDQRTFPGCVFTPYDWGVDLDRREFRQTLYASDTALGMPEESGLATLDTAKRIYAFCEGRLRPAADLIAKARRHARQLGLQKVTHDVLAEAADDFLAVRPIAKVNPFRTDDFSTERVAEEAMATMVPKPNPKPPIGRPRKEAA
jgi:hypothetical protein